MTVVRMINDLDCRTRIIHRPVSSAQMFRTVNPDPSASYTGVSVFPADSLYDQLSHDTNLENGDQRCIARDLYAYDNLSMACCLIGPGVAAIPVTGDGREAWLALGSI